MRVLELFAGTRSIGKAFEERGHQVYSIDWDEQFDNIDWHADIGKITAQDILERLGHPDVIWASPDCTTFSVMAIGHHRRKNPVTGNLDPVSEYAKQCDIIDVHVLQLIQELKPKFWFIENPRGGMRKMDWMQGLPRYTVTYCKYGDTRMKPTDIWTNHPCPQFLPPCQNGDTCHMPSPRGATVKKMREAGLDVSFIGGTQWEYEKVDRNMRGVLRSKIPDKLCQHIVDICEMDIETPELKIWDRKLIQMSLFD